MTEEPKSPRIREALLRGAYEGMVPRTLQAELAEKFGVTRALVSKLCEELELRVVAPWAELANMLRKLADENGEISFEAAQKAAKDLGVGKTCLAKSLAAAGVRKLPPSKK